MTEYKGKFKSGFDPRRKIGRSKVGLSLAEKIRDAMNEEIKDGYTRLDALIDEAMEQAKAGNSTMLEMLWSRGYGKVADKLEVSKEEAIDLSKLTDEELAEWKRLQEKAHADSKPV